MGFFIQSNYGVTGDFEVVVPRLGGGLDQWRRNNDDPALPWAGPWIAFGSDQDISGASLIQSTFGPVGNFEVVFREGGTLTHSWRNSGNLRWQGRTSLPGSAAATGSPALLQSRLGSGNFEVVAPLPGGGLGHWWRNHAVAALPWNGPTKFGAGAYHAAALIQSSYNHLEVVARAGGTLVHWWRDGNGVWHGPKTIASGVAGEPGFIQGSSGAVGNFEVVSPVAGGGLGHWWRENDAPGLPWHGQATFGAGQVSAATVIETPDGDLHVVARFGDRLEHWQRGTAGGWLGPVIFGADRYPDPSVHGASTIPYRAAIVGIHAALLHTGKVVLFGFGDTNALQGESRVLDPATGGQTTPASSHHMFCSGHAFLPDGRLVVAGGHHLDLKALHTFDPVSAQWTHLGDMANGRWYPTCTALPDGRVLVISGTTKGGPISASNPVNNTLQFLLSGAGTAEPLPSPFSSHFPASLPTIDLYPFVYVLPSGQVLVHSRHVTRFYNPATHQWAASQLKTNYPFSRSYPGEGTSVLLPLRPDEGYRARVLIAGGGGADPAQLDSGTPATATAEVLDVGGPPPWSWRSVPPMAYARVMPDATLLPDGTVLVSSGSATGRADLGLDPVFPYEVFDPVLETWSTLRTMHTPRLYHSTALLLPDARVLLLGKDGVFNPVPYKYPEHRAEVFSPPYLFRGPRPVIGSAPSQVGYGAAFAVQTPDAGAVAAVNLVRPGAVTHSFDMGQRLVGLVIAARSGTTLTLQAPPDPKVAPPGHYLLFLLGPDGVPSVGKFLALG